MVAFHFFLNIREEFLMDYYEKADLYRIDLKDIRL